MARNPFVSIKKEPITRKSVEDLRNSLTRFWEDTSLVTEPNKYHIIAVGNLIAILDTLLKGKGLVEETDGKRHAQDKLPLGG